MYDQICDFNNLLTSYNKARKCKRYKRSIVQFSFFLESNLLKLRDELVSECYLPSTYLCFTVSDPKTRKVAAPAFRDRVLQHSLVATIEPLFDRQFIYDSYACRKQKGTHFGLYRIKKFLQAARSKYGKEAPIYCLRMDIEKYFASISWDVLLKVVNRTITCSRTQKLLEKIITKHQCINLNGSFITPPKDVIDPDRRRGVPIGNLTSQLFANIYLNELDHYVKEKLRVRWYARYMDDFLVIHPDLEYLHNIKKEIKSFLGSRLHLKLHPKKVIIQNVHSGIPFVGYLIFYDHILVRGKTLLQMRQKLKKRRTQYAGNDKKLEATYSSIRGHLTHANSYWLQKNLFDFPSKGSVGEQLRLL